MRHPVTRILHIITRLDVGGSSENTILSVTRMPPEEFACGLVSGWTKEPSPGIARCLAERNIQWTVVPALRREIHPLRDLCALRALRRQIREGRPKIVHTHTSKAGFLGRLAARLEHVPHIVHTPHGHVFGGYFSPAATRVFIGLERLAARWTDRIVTLTDAEAAQHLALGIGRPGQFITIASGVDLGNIASAAPVRLAPHGPVIGTVGRLTSIKGHQHLIDAVPEILSRCPAAHVVLVGDGELRQALTERTRRLGVDSRVIFTGYREDIPALIAAWTVCTTLIERGYGPGAGHGHGPGKADRRQPGRRGAGATRRGGGGTPRAARRPAGACRRHLYASGGSCSCQDAWRGRAAACPGLQRRRHGPGASSDSIARSSPRKFEQLTKFLDMK